MSGSGRSGTTWLTDRLQGGLNARVLFGPIQPRLVDASLCRDRPSDFAAVGGLILQRMDSADFFQAVESSGAGTQPEGDMSCNYRATIDRKHRVNRRFVLRVEEYNACLAPIAGHAATVGAPCQ